MIQFRPMSCKCWFCTGFPGRLLKGCWPIGGDSFVFPLFIPPVDWVLSLAHQQPSWTMRCPKGWKPALGWWNKKIGTGSLMPGQSLYQLWAAKLEVLLRWIRNKLLLCWSHFHFGFSNKIATLSFAALPRILQKWISDSPHFWRQSIPRQILQI